MSCPEIGSKATHLKREKHHYGAFLFGWPMGFEPTTLGTTIRCSNRLSYGHHIVLHTKGIAKIDILSNYSTNNGKKASSIGLRSLKPDGSTIAVSVGHYQAVSSGFRDDQHLVFVARCGADIAVVNVPV